jgi:uncharacterized protein (TIGR02145 family)
MKNKFILPLLTILFFASCKKEKLPPLVTTGFTKNLKSTSVLIVSSETSQDLLFDGKHDPVVQRGVCYGLNPNPTLSNDFTSNGSGYGSFESSLTSLEPNTTYYFRAYAKSSKGVIYGEQKSFKTYPALSTVPGAGVQMDGYNYQTVVFGNGQEWMAENLRTTKYANGNSIPNVPDNNQWSNLTTGAWSHYNNDSQMENPYGKLYNGYAVLDARNVCPTGWHVPSIVEWSALVDYLGGDSIAGVRMKHDVYWPNNWSGNPVTGTNESGLGIVHCDLRNSTGDFYVYGMYPDTRLWSSTTTIEPIFGSTYIRDIQFNSYVYDPSVEFSPDGWPQSYGMNIRCIKN